MKGVEDGIYHAWKESYRNKNELIAIKEMNPRKLKLDMSFENIKMHFYCSWI